ncbi:MAG TPA: MaoC family dehydratase [Myxococcales bacterium]|jgi:acyl dehydratase|nr:MaoC family dehydratase [Myxococcales bacterium]
MGTKIVIEGVAGLQALAGKSVGATDWHPLKFEDIKAFADATGDHQWIHVDRERCRRESPYGAPIAHGYYTVSRIAGLFFELADIRGFAAAINYGLNKVRFPAPLKEGARYRLSVKMGELKEVQGGVEGIFHATIEIENEPKPACVAEAVYRYLTGGK